MGFSRVRFKNSGGSSSIFEEYAECSSNEREQNVKTSAGILRDPRSPQS